MMNLSSNPSEKKTDEKLLEIINAVFQQLEDNKLFLKLNLNIMFQPSTRKILETQIKERATQLFIAVKQIFDQIDSKRGLFGRVFSKLWLSEKEVQTATQYVLDRLVQSRIV